MKRFLLLLPLLAMLLPECGTGHDSTASAEAPYTSDISAEDCYLCGGGIENLIPSFYWGQDNLALISLNKILPSQSARCFGVGVIHFDTKEIRVFEKQGGFGLGDFYIDCDWSDQDISQMNILIFYCPIRYLPLSVRRGLSPPH